MCGIAGAIGALGNPSAARSGADRLMEGVARMSAAMKHRGPDGDGFWLSPGSEVILAHRRLAILDLSEAGAQPMVDSASGCVIAFNGEVYNFHDLRARLAALGEEFHSTSDTEVILKAYKHWGLDAIPKLRGIFALAIWDPRSREVHLVRDQQGIKPLYWSLVPSASGREDLLLFASEVRALLASGLVRRKLNPSAVASYLSNGFVVGPETMVEGVQLLPSGSILTLSASPEGPNRQAIRTYWQPPVVPHARSSEEELRQVLSDTVRMQLVSDAPLGIFLSGGIDSSAVAAIASKIQPGGIHTFTIGFEEAVFDESPHAAAVANAIGSNHRTVTLREGDFLAHLPEALSSLDQPTFDALNTYFVSRAAREAGMTVALAGTGGDELFGGYTSFVDLPRIRRLSARLPGAVLGGLGGIASSAIGTAFWSALRRVPPQTRWGKVADIARAHTLLDAYQVTYALFTRETQERLAAGAVREALRRHRFGLPEEVERCWQERTSGGELLHAISMLELSSFLGERLLRDTDAASMAVSLEVRVPLIDHVLWETVAGIAPVRRFLPIRRKQLLRDVALSHLDPAFFDRPKSGFVLPIEAWARRALQREMDGVLSDPVMVSGVGLSPDTVKTIWRSFQEGRAGLHWSRVWSLFVLCSWCRDHKMVLDA